MARASKNESKSAPTTDPKPPKTEEKSTRPHVWRFFRSGGVDQVRIDRGADIANLKHLDQKLWVALSCPVKGLEFDEKTLALIDTEGDDRVRAPELLKAIDWTLERIKDADGLLAGSSELPLAMIDDSVDEGKQLKACAKRILSGIGKSDAAAITVGDAASAEKSLAKLKLNGDGVLPPSSVDDPAASKVVEEALACVGGETDRGGEQGVSRKKLNQFYAALEAFSDWRATGEADAARILPLGEATAAAYAAIEAVRPKVEDYFARCRLAAYDERALAALTKRQDEHFAAAASDMTISLDELAGLPISKVTSNATLSLVEGVNPAHAPAVAELERAAIVPLVGNAKELTESDWHALCGKVAAYGEWIRSKDGVAVESLGIARIRAILAGGEREVIENLLTEDETITTEMSKVAELERLVRYYRDLHKLLNNFVSFTDFYSRRAAIFQAGTLYIDGRSCTLCVKVDSADKHAGLAVLSKSYLAYCDCTRPPSNQKMTIAVAFTAGDSDHLMVGRNGVFYDKKGRDWDATIVRIIDQPISLGQAFWSPYKRLQRFIEEQATKRAVAADAASTDKLHTGVVATTDAALKVAPAAAPAPAPAPPKPKMDIGVVAAIGVAAGTFLGAFSVIMQSFFGLGRWMPLGIVGLVLCISGPSMFIAWLKLRQRNLGPILDANGWAVNGRVMVNIPLGQVFTDTAKLPPGAERSLTDPYAVQKPPWVRYTILIVVIVLLVLAIVYHEQVVDCAIAISEKFQPHDQQQGVVTPPAGPPPAAK